MATGKFISYLRVSTDRQGKSGLGLEAQRHFGVPISKVQHAEYLAHWVNALRENPHILHSASTKAQQAYDYLLRLGGEQVAFDMPLASNE